jgi:hypothetical protein
MASKGALCTALAAEENLVRFLTVPGGGLANDLLFPANKIRKQLCNSSVPVTLPTVPWSGGQCDCHRYQINVTLAYRQGDGPWQSTDFRNRFRGPIEKIEPWKNGSGSSHGVTFKCRGFNFTDLNSWPSCGSVVFPTNFRSVAGDPVTDQYILNVEIEQAPDGDDCGGKIAPPFTPVIVTRNFTYVDNREIEFTEEGDFVINAPILIGGNLIAPITVNVGGVEFPLNFNLSTGDIDVNFEVDFPSPEPPIGEENPVDNPTDDEPEQETDELIYGLILYGRPIAGPHVNTTLVDQGDAPILNLPRISNVYFQIPVGDRVSWVGPIPHQLENQVVMVPFGLGASGYRISPNTGWTVDEVRIGKPPCGCVPS